MDREAPGDPPVESVRVDEVRLLEGPNLYVRQPAIKLGLALPGYLGLSADDARALARRAGLGAARPGRPGTEQRQRFVMRLVAHLVRSVAAGAGVRRLTVRVRAGRTVADVVVAVPWRRRGHAVALGEGMPRLLAAALDPTVDLAARVAELAARVAAAPVGEPAAVVVPRVPVIAITGTNGKTTTTRMVAHLAMAAGLRTAWSSTDGVFVMGELTVPGDYSGPGGARAVLATPDLDIGILETARGGMLLRGMGVAHADVAVVTNVAADHLGLHGIETLDQLAEVKAIPTRIVGPSGWVVLNGDDPRVWAMRQGARGRPWAFSLDPEAPALREALAAGGRGMTVLDGDIVVLERDRDPDRLVKVIDVPLTLAGLSRINVANALGAAAGGLALGLPRSAVVAGLRSFRPDPELNAGRFNCYSVPVTQAAPPLAGDPAQSWRRRAATVVVDMAHNEAGIEALIQACRGLTGPGGRVLLCVGMPGDRTEEAIRGVGSLAGRGADLVTLAHRRRYVRGRTAEQIDDLLRVGLGSVGVGTVVTHPGETEALQAMVDLALPGDVVGLVCHEQRAEVADLLAALGATADDPAAIRRKVVAGRGEHEAEADIAAMWARPDLAARVEAGRVLADRFPGDPRITYELACAVDASGDRAAAVTLYHRALDAGLPEPHAHRARLQAAAAHRDLGRPLVALQLLDEVLASHPGNAVVSALRALTLHEAGRHDEAVADLVDALLDHSGDDDATAYRDALRAAAVEVRGRTAR